MTLSNPNPNETASLVLHKQYPMYSLAHIAHCWGHTSSAIKDEERGKSEIGFGVEVGRHE